MAQKTRASVSLDAERLLAVAKAIGAADGVELTIPEDPRYAIRVEPLAKTGAFVLLMPLRSEDVT